MIGKHSAEAVHLGPAARLAAGLSLAVLGAVMFTLAFPPYDLWPLAFIWMVPVMIALHRVMPARFSGLALGLGVGGFFWGYFRGMFAGSILLEYLPLLIVAMATLIGMGERAFHARTGYRWFILQGTAVWVGIEMIRGFIPVAGTWGFAAYALYKQPWFIQPVSIFGIYGLSLLIMLFNYALAKIILSIMDRRWVFETADCPVETGRAQRWLAAVCAALVAWTVLSLAMYRVPEPELQAAAIQPGAYITPESDMEEINRGLDLIGRLTREAAEEGARFIVWPEGFLPFDPQEKESAFFIDLAADTGSYLVIGYNVRTEVGLRNEAAVLSPAGSFLGVFGKDHPVSFAGESSITRGSYPAYETPLGMLGTIICYDLDFTDTTRKVARNGARLIGVPSFDWPAIAQKHYSHLVFRAVENRMAMVKADVAWDSAIIDPYGNIIESFVTVEPGQAVLTGSIPLSSSRTIYTLMGDWVGWICIFVMVIFWGGTLYCKKIGSDPILRQRG